MWFAIFVAASLSAIWTLSSFIEVNKLVAVPLTLILWPLTFPLVVKAVKYKKRQYYVPESRVVGYFLYLVLPVSVIVLVVTLAIIFEVGM